MHNDMPVTSQGSSHRALAARLTAVLESLPKPGEVVTDVTTISTILLFVPLRSCAQSSTESRRSPSAVWEKADADRRVLWFKIWRQALLR